MFQASPLVAAATARTVFEWGRIESAADWILPLGVLAALCLFARWMIRLDTPQLHPWVGWLLTSLRVGLLLCLLVIYLKPQWRAEHEVVRNSRVLLLVDTSSSMGLADADASPGSGGLSRVEQVARAWDRTGFLDRLRKAHDVVVWRFDEDLGRVASLEKLAPGSVAATAGSDRSDRASPGAVEGSSGSDAHAPQGQIDWEGSLVPTGTQTRLGESLRRLVHQERNRPVSGIVLFSDGGQNAGASAEAAIEAAREAKLPVFTVGLGSKQRLANVRVWKLEAPSQAYAGDPYSVTGLIQAHGLAGETVSVQLLLREGDPAASSPEAGSGAVVGEKEVVLGGDGEVVPVKFEVSPAKTGRQTVSIRVRAPQADSHPGDDLQEEEVEIVTRKTRVLLFAGGPTREYRFLRTHLYREASTTVDVLLQTAQPGLSQEADQILDAFPSSRHEMYAYDCVVALDPDWQRLTHGSADLLEEGQVDLLESWVAEQGGGLIVVAGPVHAGESISGWVQNPDMAKVQALYPVELRRGVAAPDEGRGYGSNRAWALDFTPEGLEAEFLWLDDSPSASQQAWAAFGGVYGCWPARRPKPGAAVLAYWAQPRAGRGDRRLIYLAEQFYGSGRVFYLASGEMWRLRRVDEAHFERFYTQLIRHVSQGRLFRQSSRGALIVGQDRYGLGDTVEVRARLTNARLAPLEAAEVPLQVIQPDGGLRTVPLLPDAIHKGMYAGRFTVLSEGLYRLELWIPESDGQRLTRRVRVRIPDLERENPQRDEKLLSQIAGQTGGKYYDKLEAALGRDVPDPLVERLRDRTRTVIQTTSLGPPSLAWLVERHAPQWLREQAWYSWLVHDTWFGKLLEQTVLWWVMITACSLLCCEWLIRRLCKLA